MSVFHGTVVIAFAVQLLAGFQTELPPNAERVKNKFALVANWQHSSDDRRVQIEFKLNSNFRMIDEGKDGRVEVVGSWEFVEQKDGKLVTRIKTNNPSKTEVLDLEVWEITETITQKVPVTKTRIVVENGETLEVTYTELVDVTMERSVRQLMYPDGDSYIALRIVK